MGRSVRDSAGRSGPGAAAPGTLGVAILGGGLLGAVLLLMAELATLFVIHAQGTSRAVGSVSTGSHHAYALVPVALVAGALAVGVWQAGSRPALLAIGLLGLLSLLIALLGDLPDAHANGLIGINGGHYAVARASPSAGIYLETLGAVVLLITCVSGFLLAAPPAPRPRRPPREPRLSDV